jgi:hypothetical protein
MFSFIFLSCYFLLLPSAEAELKYHIECEQFFYPGDPYVEEISFPYTTNDNKECRFYITAKQIDSYHKIDCIKSINNSIFIYIQNYSDFDLDSIKNTPKFSLNTSTFYGCNHGSDAMTKTMSKYSINCDDYDIYFTSNPDYPPMPINFPFPCSKYHPRYGCAKLFSLLEIKVEQLPPPYYYNQTKRKERSSEERRLEAAVIGTGLFYFCHLIDFLRALRFSNFFVLLLK